MYKLKYLNEFESLIGYMFKYEPKYIYVFEAKGNYIHTFLCNFNILIYFIDDNYNIIDKIKLEPWKIIKIPKGTKYIIEVGLWD
jgi:uncharacterized membrane protein (UPF0127 family)